MKTTILGAVIAAALTSTTLAAIGPGFGNPSLTDADDLILQEGETYVLDAGMQSFDDIVLPQGATIRFAGSTSIRANRLHSDGGTIVYDSGTANGGTPVASIVVFDAKDVAHLKVVGDGLPGAGYEDDARAADGGAGRGARCRITWKGVENHGSDRGGPGANGANGSEGEDALQLTGYFVGLTPGALVEFDAVGGQGGRGQDAGNGGPGGGAASCHRGSAGGQGGVGGAGGNGGDSGRIQLFLVADDIEAGEKADYVRVVANVAAGEAGKGGDFGSGGANGNGCPKYNVGSCGQPQSVDGTNGPDGARGAGPVAGGTTADYVIVDVMSTATFVAHMAAQDYVDSAAQK